MWHNRHVIVIPELGDRRSPSSRSRANCGGWLTGMTDSSNSRTVVRLSGDSRKSAGLNRHRYRYERALRVNYSDRSRPRKRVTLQPLVSRSMAEIGSENRNSDGTATADAIRSREIIYTHTSQRETRLTVCKRACAGLREFTWPIEPRSTGSMSPSEQRGPSNFAPERGNEW